MGVYGLTSYVRDNQRHLATNVTFQRGSQQDIRFVVDGWSFIYGLSDTLNLPWVYGGEYNEFYKAVIKTVEAWLSLGITAHFVFDGIIPETKFGTRVRRQTENFVTPALLFYRTSIIARSAPRFLAEASMLPPYYYQATVHALYSLKSKGVEVHFADDEADRFAVELAGQVQAYVLSNDSDFLIMNCDGYKGYVPFRDLSWTAAQMETPMTSPTSSIHPLEFDDLGFQIVRKAKGRKKATVSETHLGLIPPDQAIGISFLAFSPDLLAKHLNLQPALLPLFGSLAGNDITNNSDPTTKFFERGLNASQRIKKVTSVLQTLLNPTKKKDSRSKPATGMELIRLAIQKLLLRPDLVASGERVDVENAIVDSILQYAITPSQPPQPPTICSVHDAESCPLVLIQDPVPEELEVPDSGTVRTAYIKEYRRGRFGTNLLNVVGTATFWPVLTLEDPDRESCQVSMGRGIRLWIYALLELSVGIPRMEPEPEQSERANGAADSDEEDPDELIDVVEEHTDEECDDNSVGEEEPVAVGQLRTALRRISMQDVTKLDESAATSDADQLVASPPVNSTGEPQEDEIDLEPPIVTEYVRRGTRVADVQIEVPPFSDLYPSHVTGSLLPQLAPQEMRLKVLFTALESDVDFFYVSLESHHLVALASLRYVIHTLGGRPNEEERWTKREAQCLLNACFEDDDETSELELPEVTNRHIQLTSQFLSAYSNAIHLLEVLLLTGVLETSLINFSGKRFHRLLSSNAYRAQSDELATAWEACQEGLDGCWGIERGSRGKKGRRKERKAAAAAPEVPRAKRSGNSLFAALADIV